MSWKTKRYFSKLAISKHTYTLQSNMLEERLNYHSVFSTDKNMQFYI